jgi:Flp pilus assembly protein TadG
MEMKRLFHEARSAMNQRGVTAILVALLLVVLVGFTALAIDVGHLVFVRNELQNAADAGALAGARFLYEEDGTAVNVEANQRAYAAARDNRALSTAGAIAVDVNWSEGQNAGANVDVQRGHWSFATREFTANDSLVPVDLWNVSDEELDNNPDFINAVRVMARRQATPAFSFFARIFGHQGFQLSAEAVAYIGFAGTLEPYEVNQPIGICKQSIIDEDGHYTCTVGRMIPSTDDTGGWTGFGQEEDGSCPPGGTNSQEVKDLVETGCLEEGANDTMLNLGGGITFNEGQIDIAFQKLIECWEKNAGDPPTQPWKLTLPVVDCSEGGPTCRPLVGAVELNIIWIIREGPQYNDPLHPKNDDIIPWKMGGWSSTNPNAEERWNDFAAEENFNLQTTEGPITWEWLKAHNVIKTIFFLPDCTPHIPEGVSGGENFGILAKIPVLVK